MNFSKDAPTKTFILQIEKISLAYSAKESMKTVMGIEDSVTTECNYLTWLQINKKKKKKHIP